MPMIPVVLRGQPCELDTSPVDVIVIGADRYDAYHPAETTLVLRVSRWQQLLAGGALLIGLSLIVVGLLVLTIDWAGAILVIGGLGTGVPVGLINWRPTHHFDRSAGTWRSAWLLVLQSSQPLDSIAAIQLGRGKWLRKKIPRGPRLTRQFLYQFHLVLGDGPFTRYLVCMHHDARHLLRVAEELARFLDVPLIVSPEVRQEFGLSGENSG